MDAGGRVKKQPQLTYEAEGIPLALIVLFAAGMWAIYRIPRGRAVRSKADV